MSTKRKPEFIDHYHTECHGKIFQHFAENGVRVHTLCHNCNTVNPASIIRKYDLQIKVRISKDDPVFSRATTHITIPIYAENFSAAAEKLSSKLLKAFGDSEPTPIPNENYYR